MVNRTSLVTAVATVATGLVAPAALASGGGTSSGGGGTGGGSVPAPAAGAAGCIASFAAQTGSTAGFATIWTQFATSTVCGSSAKWTLSFHNDSTGAVELTRSGSPTTFGGYDYVRAAYATTYTVTLTVTNSSGQLADSRSLDIATHGGLDTP